MPEHIPSTSRRRILHGAAWTAPAIVLATAAPAFAASGRANVTSFVLPTADVDGKLPVTIQFRNRNTGSTGQTNVFVRFTPNPASGTVQPDSATDVTNGWRSIGSSSDPTKPNFTFVSATGIPGASTPDGIAESSFSFVVTVLPATPSGVSAGTITVAATLTEGDFTGVTGTWA